ncbi:oxidoreductase [Rhodococcoides trifolii]|uniref:Oxidoreductase n=1 Tax=Rhodococcoides trifolii TaxID=908250 RepID=A0A917LDV9_9NOCA|nr:SDR family NAD(P)-dependent oxidoreductase [Rhodococcus trifolii]GGG15273.1 oxidoreductase [Rhodococcus trifolii]
MDISGKHFIVVGASGALGSLIARGLADAGATLTLAGRNEHSLNGLGIDGAHVVTGDLRQPDAPRSMVDKANADGGRLDGVVIASGIAAFGSAADVDDDTVDDLLLVNYLAPLRLTRAALGVMEKGAVILNISAVLVETPTGNMAAYSASKSAISAFFTAVRHEARRSKIRIVDVRPPHTETGLVDRAIAGSPPKLPTGLDPARVADRIVAAIRDDETEVASSDF